MNTSLKALTGDNDDDDGISNVTNAFRKIYTSIVQQPVSNKKKLYLPSFYIESSICLKGSDVVGKVQLENENGVFSVGMVNVIERIKFGNDNGEGIVVLDEENREEVVVVGNTFLIGVIDSDLLCELQMLTLSAFIVGKDKWMLVK